MAGEEDHPLDAREAGEPSESDETPLASEAVEADSIDEESGLAPEAPLEPMTAAELPPDGPDPVVPNLVRADAKSLSDEDCMLRCQLGEMASFDELFARYNRAALSFLRRMVGEDSRAEQVAQEAFLRIFREADSYEHPRKFSTWFYAILRNLAKNELRYRSRHHAVSLEEELSGPGGPDSLKLRDCLRSPDAGPLDEMLRAELERRVRQAVECLPEKSREVLLLHRFQGLNYREIAEITSTPLGTVRSRLHSALGQLRRMMKDLL